MKVAEKNSQSGRWLQEPKPTCCGEYMRKSTIRIPPDYQNYHVGWICMKCGKQTLDDEKFKVLKDVLNE